MSSSTRLPSRWTISSAPHIESAGDVGRVDGQRDRRRPPRPAAAPMSSRVAWARSGSTTTPTTGSPARGAATGTRAFGPDSESIERAPLAEVPDGGGDLFGKGQFGPAQPRPFDGHDLDGTDVRGRSVLAPRAGAEIGRGQRADPLGGYRVAAGRVDLRRVGQAFGAGEDRREPDLGLQPAVVVLAAGVDAIAFDREVAHAREEREVEQLGQLRSDLAGVGVDRVAAGQHEIEGTGSRQRGRKRACGRERVGPGERDIGDVHAGDVDPALEPPRDRFAQRVVGGRWPERQHRDASSPVVRRRARTTWRPRGGSTDSSRARCRRAATDRRPSAPSLRTSGSA